MKLDEVALDLFRNDIPQRHLADAWRVDDPAAGFERDQLCAPRRVFSFLRPRADFAGVEDKARLNGVQQ